MRTGGDGAEPVLVEHAFRRHTRPDAGFVFALAAALEQRPDIFPLLFLHHSGCSYLASGRLEVADFARQEFAAAGDGFAAAFLPTALNETRAVAFARERSTGMVTAAEIARDMSGALGSSVDDCIGLLRELVRLGVLVTELRVPPSSDRGTLLLDSLARVATDEAERFASMLASSARADASDLADAPSHDADAASVAKELVAEQHWRQVDSTRTYAGSLGSGVTDDLEAVLRALVPLSRVVSTNAAIANAFLEKYAAGREIPLLALLDQSEGLPFERAIETDATESAALDAALLILASRAIRDGLTSIAFDPNDLAVSPRPNGHYPAHVEALCHVGREAGGRDRVVLFVGAHAGAHLTLGRFYPDLRVDPVAEPADRDTVDAELAILPHMRRSGNVTGRRAGVDYQLICGVRSTRPPSETLTLDDLVVGVRDDRVYIRSLRLDRFVRIVQNDVANTAYLARIAQFFEAVFAPDVRAIAFDWGRLAGRLPFTPRVTIGGIAVSPAIWRVPKSIASDMESSASRDWRAAWRVPRLVYAVDQDNRLLLDLDHRLCRSIVEREATRLDDGDVLEFYEALPGFGDGLPDVDGERYFAEAAISFRCTFPEHEEPAVRSAPIVVASRGDRLRPLGSEWIYAKFYIGAPRASYFLERSVTAMLAEMDAEIDLFHFLRYFDPEHHVRVRFRARNAGDARAARERAVLFVETLTRAGIVDGAVWGVYDREVERYGGARSIETAERIFDVDSRALVSAFHAFRTSDDATRDLLRDLADFTLALFGSERDALETLRAAIGRRDRLTANQWTLVRAVRQTPRSTRYDAITERGARLRENAGTDPAEIARVLLHMHCNRLGLHTVEESRALHLIVALFEGDLAKR